MRAIDAAAPEPVEVLVDRAAAAVARTALGMLGGAYGRRVVVIAGKGNNGADGRVAARRLARRGVAVRVVAAPDAAELHLRPDRVDLVIDAAYGTGFRGRWRPPRVDPGVAVLAVDIPSGVDGLTGEAEPGAVLAADRTVTFAARKPGLVFPPGRTLAGVVEVADIGLDCSGAQAWLVGAGDVAGWVAPRGADAHKWRAAVAIVAGSAGMTGAAVLAARAAQRAGAGMVRLGSPGGLVPDAPIEAVQRPLPATGWATPAAELAQRCHAIVVGPGLGRSDAGAASLRELVATASVPVVVDGDGLWALAWSGAGVAGTLRRARVPVVLTPHDGEYALLTGERVGPDRLAAARSLARNSGAVVVLKGPATVVADPMGRTLVVTSGDERLATAGTGDVLAGTIGAFLARGAGAVEAAAAGAWVNGRAAALACPLGEGLVASDLPDAVAAVLGALR